MNLKEFKELYNEYGEVVAKLRVTELTAPLEEVAEEFPEALRLINTNPYVWSNLLIKRPEVACFYDLNNFDGHCWSWLLAASPGFADQCDFNKLSGSDWYFLLVSQPNCSHFFRQLDPAKQAELIQETTFINEVLVGQ